MPALSLPEGLGSVCRNRHLRTPENDYSYPSGKRVCYLCHRERTYRWRTNNAELNRQQRRAWKKANPDRIRLQNIKAKLKSQYGLSLDEFNRRLASQGHACGCCGRPFPDERSSVHVDHDHETGALRDLLCNGCNLAIGMIDDDPVRADAIASYLRKHRG